MNRLIKGGLILLFSVSTAFAAINHTPAQLVSLACPNEWQNLDVVIEPDSVSWANSTDKNQFIDYQKTYMMDVSKAWGAMDARYADDALTVASECALRKNKVVDNHFNKAIDTLTLLKERFKLVPIIMSLLFD